MKNLWFRFLSIILYLFIVFFPLPERAYGAVISHFTPGKHAQIRSIRGVKGINLEYSKASASTEFELNKMSKGSLWVKVFFPLLKNQKLEFDIDKKFKGEISGGNKSGLWNEGNVDVWYWYKIFQGKLEKGRHIINISKPLKGSGVVSKAVWTESPDPWKEDWFFGKEISRSLNSISSHVELGGLNGQEKVFEVALREGIFRAGSLRNEKVSLLKDDDYWAFTFSVKENFAGTINFKLFTEWKNNYEGWTLDELGNTAYIYLDGELKRTLWGENGYSWKWFEVENIRLIRGRHLIVIKKRGKPLRLGKVVFSSGNNFPKKGSLADRQSDEPSVDPFLSNDAPLQIVARLPTGFGVPGNGFPKFLDKDTVLLPGGEGAVTAVDISNPENPSIYRYYLNWYFNNEIFAFQNGFFINSRHRGVYYVDQALNQNRQARFRKVELDIHKHGRIGALFQGNSEFPIGITKGGKEGAAIMDMTEPLHPKILKTVEGYNGNWFLSSQDNLSAGFISKSGRLGILDFRLPLNISCKTGIKVPYVIQKGEKQYSALIGLSESFVFLKSESRIHVFKRIGVFDAFLKGIIKIDPKAGPFIRAYDYGEFIHVIDGVKGPGQYSINTESRHSRWHVYDPEHLEKPLSIYEDPFPTAYSYTTFKEKKAYVFDYNYGLWIFDLNDPKRPRKMGGIATAGEGHYLHILDNNVACLSQTFGGTLNIIDVDDPVKPEKMGQFWDGVWFSYDTISHTDLMTGKGNVLYFSKRGKGIQIIDFKMPDKPIVLDYIKGGKCRVIKNRLYTITGRELMVYDIKNERIPTLLGKLDTGRHNLSMAIDYPDRIWLAGQYHILVVDLSKIDKPKIIGEWKEIQEGRKRKFWGGITYHDGYLFGSYCEKPTDHTIAIVDVLDPENMKLVSVRNWQKHGLHTRLNDTWANFYKGDLLVYGKYLIASNYGRIELYDISNPLMPEPAQTLNAGFQWSCGRIKDGYLYIPTLNGLVVAEFQE